MSRRLFPSMWQKSAAESGITTLELALVLPLLATLLLGSIEVANIIRIQTTLSSAASIVARQVAVDPTVRTAEAATAFMTDNHLIPLVTQTSAGASPPVLTLTPENPSCSTTEVCTPFELTINYTYAALIPPLKQFFDGITLTTSVKKTAEPGTGNKLVSE